MIRHVWTVPCRVSLIDRDSNNVSLVEVVEEVVIGPPPAAGNNRMPIPAIFDVVSLWSRQDLAVGATGFGQLSFVSPTGERLAEMTFDIDLRMAQRTRSMGKFFGLPAKQPGLYHFVVEYRGEPTAQWQEVARVPLLVGAEPPSGAEATAAGGA
jgi:hypothetical protein